MIINLPLTLNIANKTTVRKIDIARACGVSRQLVQHWCTGKSVPNAEYSGIISELFKTKGVECSYFSIYFVK